MNSFATGVDTAAAGSRNWAAVANALGTGRTDAQCRKQWETLQNQRQRAEEARKRAEEAAATQTVLPASATRAIADERNTNSVAGSVAGDGESVGQPLLAPPPIRTQVGQVVLSASATQQNHAVLVAMAASTQHGQRDAAAAAMPADDVASVARAPAAKEAESSR